MATPSWMNPAPGPAAARPSDAESAAAMWRSFMGPPSSQVGVAMNVQNEVAESAEIAARATAASSRPQPAVAKRPHGKCKAAPKVVAKRPSMSLKRPAGAMSSSGVSAESPQSLPPTLPCDESADEEPETPQVRIRPAAASPRMYVALGSSKRPAASPASLRASPMVLERLPEDQPSPKAMSPVLGADHLGNPLPSSSFKSFAGCAAPAGDSVRPAWEAAVDTWHYYFGKGGEAVPYPFGGRQEGQRQMWSQVKSAVLAEIGKKKIARDDARAIRRAGQAAATEWIQMMIPRLQEKGISLLNTQD